MTRGTTYPAQLLVVLLVFSSCATVLNSPVQNIKIATDKRISNLSVPNCIDIDSSLMGADAPRTYLVRRSYKDIVLHFQLDSMEKTVVLRHNNSFAFWFNIYANYGLGILVDEDNLKRYGYPRWTYLAVKDSTMYRRRFAPIPKGTVRCSLGIPLVTSFSLRSPEGQYSPFGILGVEVGIDYFYKKDRYLSLSGGIAASVRAVEHFNDPFFRHGVTMYGSLKNNYVVGSFDLGYGVSLSQLEWVRSVHGDSVRVDERSSNMGLGLSLSVQYRIGEAFRIGLLYQPTIFSPGLSPAFGYQHYLSLNLAWRFPFNDPPRRRMFF